MKILGEKAVGVEGRRVEREGITVPSGESLDGFSFPTHHKLQFALNLH